MTLSEQILSGGMEGQQELAASSWQVGWQRVTQGAAKNISG